MQFIWFIIIGGIAGWLAGKIMRGKSFGIWGNILVGIIGSVLGGWLFGLLGLGANGTFGSFVLALAGSLILLWLARLLMGNKNAAPIPKP